MPLSPPVESIHSLLPQCVSVILETMFFTEATPALEAGTEQEAAHLAQACTCAALHFQGHPSGRLWLWVTTPAATTLAAGFLGLDPDEVDARQSGGMVCELGNMICGRMLSLFESG